MAADDRAQREGEDHRRARRVTVLVADDNARFRAGVVRALRRHDDVEVVGEAEDGAEALERVRALRPAVVLADVRMPGLDGLGLARAITEDPGLEDVRVLLLSARHDEALRADADDAGATDCLDKSVSRREICDAVRGVVLPGTPAS
jgi:DNA-binding NarL/FixJ family response regulator